MGVTILDLVLPLEGSTGAGAAAATAPVDGDLVTCHYVGRLKATGVTFDSSRAKGVPFELTLGRGSVIRGWEEGLRHLPLGAQATLDITSDWAYGAEGCESNEACGSHRYRTSLDAWVASKLAAFDGDAKLAAKKGGKHGGRDGYAAFLAASTGKRYLAEKAKHMEGGEEGKT
jgi:hypothetical protein